MRRFGLLVAFAVSMLFLCSCSESPDPTWPNIQEGTVDVVTLNLTGSLGRPTGSDVDRLINVYLPPGYHRDNVTQYPVIYLLHPFGGNQNCYVDKIKGLADYLISTGQMKPFIVVMPDAGYDMPLIYQGREIMFHQGNFYTDGLDGNTMLPFRWETFFTTQLIPYVDNNYRTLARRESRGIMGVDMGGFGAIYLGIKHQELFGVMAAHSAMLDFSQLTEMLPDLIAQINSGDFGKLSLIFMAMDNSFSPIGSSLSPGYDSDGNIFYNRRVLDGWMNSYDPTTLARRKGADLNNSAIYFDAPTFDDVHMDQHALAFHNLLNEMGVRHTYVSYEGRNVEKVHYRMEASLKFISSNLAY